MIDKIEVFTHSSIRIGSDDAIVYIDPFQIMDEPHDADYVLITHPHYDHFSIDDIRKVIKNTTILVAPESMIDDAEEFAPEVKEIVAARPGEKVDVSGIELEAIPAYNTLKPFHPRRAGWVGYVMTLEGKRIYVAGDIGLAKEPRAVKCDIALIPIGGTYTIDAKKAAELVNTICPEYAIPTHYGKFVGKKTDGKIFAGLVKDPIKVVEKMQWFK